MIELEKKLFDQIIFLKEEFGLQAIKAEFETEGSSFRDLMRLRRITDKVNVPLYLKIGGVEALRDIKDSLELGVDGLIAPMVESRFGLKKFIDAVNSIYKNKKVHRSINIETENAVANLESIFEECVNSGLDNVTIGRTDLSSSYFNTQITADSDFVFNLLVELGNKIASTGMTMTLGGSLRKQSIEQFNKRADRWHGLIRYFETRKVILPTEIMLENKKSITEAHRFEEIYILAKKEIGDLFMESENARLDELKRRS
jgi:4-hydroxy-2-oxoheptanedioate aldolase